MKRTILYAFIVPLILLIASCGDNTTDQLRSEDVASVENTDSISTPTNPTTTGTLIPSKVLEAFKKDFPTATDEAWNPDGIGFETTFIQNTENRVAFYDSSGTVMITKIQLDPESIATEMLVYTGTNYPGYTVDVLQKVIRHEMQQTFYEVTLSKTLGTTEFGAELIFDTEFNVLSERADVIEEYDGQNESSYEDQNEPNP